MNSISLLGRSLCAFALLLALLLAGCATSANPGTDPNDDLDAPPPGADDDDDEPIEDPIEEDCDDGLDDDEDSLTDCEDPDCAEVFHCTWPTEIEVLTHIEFVANELAISFGVGDCFLDIQGSLIGTDATACTECDLEYAGAVSVVGGDCPEDYIEPPTQSTYGFGFLSPGERDLWKLDSDEGGWDSLGLVQSGNAVWLSEHSSPVFYDVPIFGETEVGQFHITETITDL